MILTSLMESADRGELLLIDGGMCRWHRRRDNVVVIRELLVLPVSRRNGIGRRLVKEVRSLNPGCPVLARCPEKYEESNAFWRALGFSLIGWSNECNEWCCASSTVPTAT